MSDWTYEVGVSPPAGYEALAMTVNGFVSKDVDDPVTVARLIGKHVAREFVERLFQMDEQEDDQGA